MSQVSRIAWMGGIAMMLTLAGNAVADAVPRPKYPRPDMERAQWLSLNGPWEFAETDDDNLVLVEESANYPDRIIVPFCRESSLSGLNRKHFVRNVWYRRTFEVPADWSGRRVLLHIGACDWQTRIWVNGKPVGEHVGGSAPISCDITDALVSGPNRVVIHAYDDVRTGQQAGGKQSERPESYGCLYTRTTGIWQSVWIEATGPAYITRFRVYPEPAAKQVRLTVETAGQRDGELLSLAAEALAEGQTVGQGEVILPGTRGELVLPLTKITLWHPGKPFLYDLRLTLKSNGTPVDEVKSYFGLRTVSIQGRAILINGVPVFQRTILDQGFYPTGIWTAPDESELRGDIERSMAAGFNGARLHQKVFEPRFLYWADRLGYLVWGEFPNWGLNYKDPAGHLPVVNEWREIVERDFNHPAIIGWCPFNETPAEAVPLQNTIVDLTRAMDPTRPVLESSGWTHGHPAPMLLDAHDYDQNPETFRARWNSRMNGTLPPGFAGEQVRRVPFFVSEYGGIGWNVNEGGWGYGNNPKTLDEFYARFEGLTSALLDNRYLFGFCYTQLTDIEQEQNGLYTYDRQPKFDLERLRAIVSRRAAYELHPPVSVEAAGETWLSLTRANPQGNLQPWRYTTKDPGDGWEKPGFDDRNWKSGLGGFGNKEGSRRNIRTVWRDKDIWLRATFAWDGSDFDQALLVIHHDDDVQVFLNGELLWQADRWNDDYQSFEITDRLKALLRAENTLAVHCHQDAGGQFIDLGIATRKAQAVQPTDAWPEPGTMSSRPFGVLPDGREATLYLFTNRQGARMGVTNYGAIVTHLWMPDREGKMEDVVLGYDALDRYLANSPYFGAIVGRYGNRIAKGRFTLNGREYQLATNDGPNHLHGGLKGLDKVLWTAEPVRRDDAQGLKLRYLSPDGEEGYPGNLDITVTYWLTDANELEITYAATTDKPTPVNLTHHGYFNLKGHDGGDILDHLLQLNASRFTPVDATLIPTGELRPVAGTPFDFTTPTAIGARVNQDDEQLKFGRGYDHNWVLDKPEPGAFSLAAILREPESGRVMEVWTTEPGIQFYCGNFMDGSNIGKGDVTYHYRNGLCLETQHFPDSPNKKQFPSVILNPGKTYSHRTVYRFRAE